MFEAFVEEHRENTEDPEVRFFEASIQAKLKRSKKNALASLGRVGKSESSSYLEDRTSSVSTSRFCMDIIVRSLLNMFCLVWR